MSTAPQIAGYVFAEQLLEHALATVWRGHSVSGMDVVALVLSDEGSADPVVRERLAEASRTAALEPGRAEAPLWAANLNATQPYAITQLAPGLSGAERLLDPLDGVIGNDRSAIAEVRARLEADTTQPTPLPDATPQPSVGWKLWTVPVIVPLLLFVITYSVGATVKSAMSDDEPTQPRQPVPQAVEPKPLPRNVLLPGIPKTRQPSLRAGLEPVLLVGNSYVPVEYESLDLGLPFVMHRPSENSLGVIILEESSFSIYRRLTLGAPRNPLADVWIAAHPCKDLAACRADRKAFEDRWTSRFKAIRPATAKDDRTWITESRSAGSGYEVAMTRAYLSPATNSWWLVGVDASSASLPNAPVAQAVLNDIRTQIS